MSTVEHIEATLSAGRKVPTYRVNLNPQSYKWRIICGCTDKVIGAMEWETKAEAETALMQLKNFGDV